VYDIVTDEFTDSSHKPYLKSQNQTLHGYIIYNWSYGLFVIFLPILAKTWLPWKPPLDPCNQKCLLWIGRPRKPPVISNHVLAISCRNAFICIYSNFTPKIGCYGSTPLSLVYESVTDEFTDCTALSQNQTLHGYVAYNWIYGHFVILLPILAKIWLPWQHPLDRCNQKCLLLIVQPRKPPAVSNHILVIPHTNAFICIYSYFSPKIGCHSNAPLSLVYGSLTYEFLDSANPVTKPNAARICCIQLKLWPFSWYFCLFWPQIGCHGDVL